MRVPLVNGADAFIQLNIKPAKLAAMGLPIYPYPLRTAAFERVMAAGGQVEVTDLVLGLMDWLDHTDDPEPTLDVLEQIMERHCAPRPDARGRCRFQADNGWIHSFYMGAIDWSGTVAAWQRRDWLIAAAMPAPVEAGRMLVFAPRPISLAVANSIYLHAAPLDHGLPSDSMAALRRSSESMGNFYCWEAGRETVVYWEHGLGQTEKSGALVRDEAPPIPNMMLPTNQLAWQVALANDYG